MKRFFTLVLAFIMTLSLLPMAAWAEEGSGSVRDGDQVVNLSGDAACGMRGVFFFSGLDSNAQTLVTGSDIRGEGDKEKVIVSCGAVDEKTIYLAAGSGDTLTVSEGTLSQENFTWTRTEENGQTFGCNVYAMTVARPDNTSTVECSVTRSGGDNSESFTLVFDFSTPPVDLSGNPACGEKGVFFFSGLDSNAQTLVTGSDIRGENGEVVASCAGAESKTIYLAAGSGDTLTVSEGTLSQENYTWTRIEENGQTFVCNVYAMTVAKPADGTTVECTVTRTGGSSESFTLAFDFSSRPGGGDQGDNGNQGDDRDIMVYYTTRGCSEIIVEIFPGVRDVLDFPEPGVLENDTLTLRVKSADPEDWRPLLSRGDDAFWVPYTIEAINPPEGSIGEPKIAVNGSDNLADARDNLQNMLNDSSNDHFHAYNAYDPARHDAAQYAWRSSSSGGVVRILPQTETKARAWCWRYNGADIVDQMDWFATQVVLGEGVTDVIAVTERTHPAVDAERIQLIPHTKLDEVLAFDEYKDGAFEYQDGQEGVLTYTYIGTDETKTVAEAIYAAAEADPDSDVVLDESNVLHYNLLKVTAPDGYAAKAVECRYYKADNFNLADREAVLRFHWSGAFEDLTFTLTWCDATPNDANDLPDKVEQVTISMPDKTNSGPWMSYAVIGGNTYTANPVDASRLAFDSLTGVKGVTSHAYNEETGVLFTMYDNTSIVETTPILDATFSLKAPEGAVSFHAIMGRDGTNDPAYNSFNAWKSEFFWQEAVKGQPQPIPDDGAAIRESIGALLKQTYGEEIEYYYSADEATRYLLIRWNFQDEEHALYEYLQLDTSSYHCQWEEDVKSDSEVTDEVEVPTAINDALANSDIKLVAKIHAQATAKKFFFELEMVDKNEGNVITEFDGERFTIILPYEFMGNDPNGNPWRYETAVKMKEAKILHFDDDFTLKDNNGVLFGTFTPRGIEFVVDSFSPFMLELEEKQSYTVTYAANGGSGTMSGALVYQDDTITLPACTFTAPAGKQFKAWKIGETEYAPGDAYTVTGNVTVTAVWEGIPVTTYTVSYAANGGTGEMAGTTVDANTVITLPTCTFTAPEGQQFKAWKIGDVEYAVGATYTVTGNTTITTVWEDIPVVDEGGNSSTGSSRPSEPDVGTTTVTNKDGSTTTTTKTENGTTSEITTDKNGVITSVETMVPSKAISEGEAVTLPMEVPAASSTKEAVEIKVDLPANAKGVKVEIPVEEVTPGAVAIIVHKDGTEEIVKTSVVSEDGVVLTLDGDATVKIVDNSRDFADVHDKGHWAEPFVDYAVSRELFSGTGVNTFNPDNAMTRAMLMTVLASLDDQQTTGGETWYSKSQEWAIATGISDGTNPDGNINREQMIQMLYRYAQSEGLDVSDGKSLNFADADQVSDWAKPAMEWAVANGLISGMDGNALAPQGNATRAQVATILMNFCKLLAK